MEFECYSAPDALGWIGDARALQALQTRLRADPREEIHSAAAIALGRLADHRSISALEQALSDSSLLVRSAAVAALGFERLS